jgi:hypothetical protein
MNAKVPAKTRRNRNSKLSFGAAVDRLDQYKARDQAEREALLQRCEKQTKLKLGALEQKQNARQAMLYSRLDDETKQRVWEFMEGPDETPDAE